jgi:hypothetical protein
MTKDEFTKKSYEIHKDLYTYVDLPDVMINKFLLNIRCNHHDIIFRQTVETHIHKKCGCKLCGRERTNKLNTKNTDWFIDSAIKVHGCKYDYSLVDYKRSDTKITIVCPIHDEFEQSPNDHLGGYGCILCGIERRASGKRSSASEFIEKSLIIHGDVYDYLKVVYKNAITKVEIGCSTHGIFLQTPDKHLVGGGCPKCSKTTSRGEKKIQLWLDSNAIVYEREKKFPGLCGTTPNSRLRYDFWLPDYNTLIEYDGEQHFSSIQIKGRLTKEQSVNKHLVIVINDAKKNEYAIAHGIKLIRIPYTEFKKLDASYLQKALYAQFPKLEE